MNGGGFLLDRDSSRDRGSEQSFVGDRVFSRAPPGMGIGHRTGRMPAEYRPGITSPDSDTPLPYCFVATAREEAV